MTHEPKQVPKTILISQVVRKYFRDDRKINEVRANGIRRLKFFNTPKFMMNEDVKADIESKIRRDLSGVEGIIGIEWNIAGGATKRDCLRVLFRTEPPSENVASPK